MVAFDCTTKKRHRSDICLVSFQIFCYLDYLKSGFIQNKCTFNKYKSYIIFLYYILFYFLIFLILFILFIYFIYLFILFYYFILSILYYIVILYFYIYIKNAFIKCVFIQNESDSCIKHET